MIPEISVIIPVYNVEKYLEQCLDSIINQTFKNIEIICVDDGSTDNSLKILEKYQKADNRIKILHQENKYAGVARNNGLKVARGKYLSFLDSDDFFDLNMFEKMYECGEKDNSDIIMCGWNSYNDPLKEVVKRVPIPDKFIKMSPFSPKDIAKDIFTMNKPNAWTKLFRRDFFIENNLYFEDCKCYNDMTCVHLAYTLAKSISVLKDCCVYYRNGQKTNLTSKWNDNFESLLQAISKLEERLKATNNYEIYKSSLFSRLCKVFRVRLSKLPEDSQEIFKEKAKNVLSDELYRYIDRKCLIEKNSDTMQSFMKKWLKRKNGI